MDEEALLLERAAAQEAVDKKKKAAQLLAMRKLVKTLEKKKFICIRERCDGRTFLSVERYNAHMSIHYTEDEARQKKILADKVQRIHKEQQAEVVTKRVAAVRASVLEFAELDAADTEKQAPRLRMQDPQAVDIGDGSYIATSAWNAQPHFSTINQDKNTSRFQLELVSKRADVSAPAFVSLNKSPFQLGTQPGVNCPILVMDKAKRDGCLSKVHCVISLSANADYDEPVRIHDNYSTYGTYIVSGLQDGAVKVTTSTTNGDPLSIGDLLCVGVKKYGAALLEASEASSACLVYRVKCAEVEGSGSSDPTTEKKKRRVPAATFPLEGIGIDGVTQAAAADGKLSPLSPLQGRHGEKKKQKPLWVPTGVLEHEHNRTLPTGH